MKSKYQCPYCQYMSSRKWNVQNHVRNVHRIKDFSNGSNEKPNINQQKIRPTELHTEFDCPDDKSREILQKIGAEIALHGSFLEVFRQKNVPAGFSMSSSYILSTDSKTVLS